MLLTWIILFYKLLILQVYFADFVLKWHFKCQVFTCNYITVYILYMWIYILYIKLSYCYFYLSKDLNTCSAADDKIQSWCQRLSSNCWFTSHDQLGKSFWASEWWTPFTLLPLGKACSPNPACPCTELVWLCTAVRVLRAYCTCSVNSHYIDKGWNISYMAWPICLNSVASIQHQFPKLSMWCISHTLLPDLMVNDVQWVTVGSCM